jgi:hypothetical protein
MSERDRRDMPGHSVLSRQGTDGTAPYKGCPLVPLGAGHRKFLGHVFAGRRGNALTINGQKNGLA